MKWSPEYSCRVKAIDEDHQMLFSVVERLGRHQKENGTPQQFQAAIDALVRYVDEHFEREERFLRRVGYPHFAEHKEQHENVRQLVRRLQEMHEVEPDEVDFSKVLTFLEDWLKTHILREDMRYVPYLSGEKESGPPIEVGSAENPERQSITVSVLTNKVYLINEFADLINGGGEVALAVEDAVHRLAEKKFADMWREADKLFRK